MKKTFLFIYLISLVTFGQTNFFEVKKHPSRLRLSAENIDMKGEPDMGFIGHGYEVFGLYPNLPDAYFGVTSYSAITGIRSGFFVFGVSGGYQNTFFTPKLNYDIGLFLGGGGGSGAPDGGGLMIRPHFDLSYNINPKIAIRTGVTYVEFPTGEISSLNFNLGLTLNTNTFIADKIDFSTTTETPSLFSNIEVNLLSANLFNFSKGPLKNNSTTISSEVDLISLIGATIKTKSDKNFYGIVKLGGAFIGEVDGFMMLLPGIGYELKLNDWLKVNSQALLGGAGGGNVQFGGGLAAQIEVGTELNFKDYLFNLNFGNTYAPNGNFKSNHLDISFGKRFNLYNNLNNDITNVKGEDVKLEEFNFSLANRTYFLSEGKDKSGRTYNSFFNLINFELEKKISNRIGLLLATNWAYQGDYGAYAEGWLGMQYYLLQNSENWKFSVKTLFGAGGGGNINLGSGMAYQYGVNIERKINKRWNFTVNTGQVRPVLDGNFTPLFLDVGVKLNLNQLVKK